MTMDNSFDEERNAINKLLQEIKKINHEIGFYVHHYYINSYYIIIKLTNGYLKISKRLLDNALISIDAQINAAHLKRAIQSFVKVNLI